MGNEDLETSEGSETVSRGSSWTGLPDGIVRDVPKATVPTFVQRLDYFWVSVSKVRKDDLETYWPELFSVSTSTVQELILDRV